MDTEMNHIPVISSNVVSIAYDRVIRKLEVKFKKSGIFIYSNVPENVYINFLQAPSKGKFVNTHLAYRYEDNGGHSPPSHMPLPDGDLASTVEKSWQRIVAYLPEPAHEFVKSLLKENPVKVIPVKVRVTKWGDYRRRCVGDIHKITVNKSGNPYQFLITLIHELAHARAHRDYGLTIKPHGREWRVTFSAFLHRSLAADCFPNDLVLAVRHQAFYPQISSSRAHMLQQALRPYDTLDLRPLVSELADETHFSVRDGIVLRKGQLRRHYFICVDSNGRTFRVPASDRVLVIYRENNGIMEQVTNYEDEAKEKMVEAIWDDTYDQKYETSSE